ncbi:MAG: hypothetical protein M1586_02510 [Patescibacteria group bacterium]|nr:hypothetical protein [Patescibacteria group bacterium]MCL5262144.1 hypothetical protein [Patescibacteria group bacterium]
MKFSKSYKEIVIPASMLASLIIGAGMFSLPYVTSRSGLIVGLVYLVVFTGLMSLIHLFYADVVADDRDSRFVGQSRRYLGKAGFFFGAVAILIGTTLALTIYLILTVGFASLVFPRLPTLAAAVIFWAAAGLAIGLGVKEIAGVDSLLTIFMVFLAATVAFFGLRSGHTAMGGLDLWPVAGASLLLLPLGPFLFSLNGRAAIVSLRDYFDTNRLDKRKMKQAIILGTSIPAFVYLFFIVGIIMLAAGAPAKDIVQDLAFLPAYARPVIGGLGLIAIFTSYIFLGLELKSIFERDFGLRKGLAFAATIFPALFFYLFGERNLVDLIAAAGGIFIAIESILVILMWEKTKSKKLFINRVIIIVFVLGAVYEVWKRIG